MPYLVRVTKAKAAHIWTGTDTVCTQWSTGGIKAKHKFIVTEEKPPRLSVCQMCQSNQSAQARVLRWLEAQAPAKPQPSPATWPEKREAKRQQYAHLEGVPWK